ncbi:alpha/beta fold hydrolase [Pseudonocardia sp. T1-2H]|uniref:alpha/beta fold hydrolase n=1 Tax=Pseudonocardia sp. T1-2H TaxID=3128899 RepID=UPI00310113B7
MPAISARPEPRAAPPHLFADDLEGPMTLTRAIYECAQSVLAAPPEVVRDLRIDVDGVPAQYLDAGAGPPLVLLHGHEQSAAGWRWVIPALARTHRVLALSLPGHGETAPAVGAHAPGRDLAPFVTAFLDALGLGEVDLVGHSSGGAVALNVALSAPRRLRSLTLVASAGLGRQVNPLLALDTVPGLGELAILLSRTPGGALARTALSMAMLFARPWRAPGDFVAEQHALARRPGQLENSTTMARALFDATGQREVVLDRLAAVTVPTLVIWGARDYVLPASQAGAAAHRLPGARVSVFPDCGHLPHVEHPDRFSTELAGWLAEQRAVHRPPTTGPNPPPTEEGSDADRRDPHP